MGHLFTINGNTMDYKWKYKMMDKAKELDEMSKEERKKALTDTMQGVIKNEFQTDELIHRKGQEYGPPEKFMDQLSKVWSGVTGVDISPEEASTMMLLFKVIRLYNNPSKTDTKDDILGYLKIVEMLESDVD